jgi:hypothetical protein|tara:strand:- start:81 stop:341 length:261 start_codon:yes stop_codon:yes gene_type:complete
VEGNQNEVNELGSATGSTSAIRIKYIYSTINAFSHNLVIMWGANNIIGVKLGSCGNVEYDSIVNVKSVIQDRTIIIVIIIHADGNK